MDMKINPSLHSPNVQPLHADGIELGFHVKIPVDIGIDTLLEKFYSVNDYRNMINNVKDAMNS